MSSSASRHRPLAVAVLGITSLALAVQGATAAPPTAAGDAPTADQERALAAGFQVAPKAAEAARGTGARPNPYLANGFDETKADYAAWRQRMAAAGQRRADSARLAATRAAAHRTTPAKAGVIVHDETEPAGTAGSNDTAATAELIAGFGTAASKNNVVRILGSRADLPTPAPEAIEPGVEDDGAIPLATDTGIAGSSAVTTSGVLGDGPHGSEGDATNDFDVYAVDLDAGLGLTADTSGQATDTILALYDADGEIVATDDDSGTGAASLLTFGAAESGTYYLLVGGYSFAGPLPADPDDSGSGAGGADEGPYDLAITQAQSDSDKFAVRLKRGDVLGGVANGNADALTVYRPDGTEMVGSELLDASALYAPESPLPGGGNTTFAYVAEGGGTYVIDVGGDVGDYAVRLEAYRPGAETDTDRNQTVLLDFEGGRVNTGLWGGPGVRELSPFSAFLGKWGLTRGRERAMINKITEQVRRNLQEDVADGGLNNPRLTVVNSRTHPELRGRRNVSRVVVGGTIEESGISTIGIAQYIDPGNYGHEDTALVLLDVLSDPEGPASLNTYLAGGAGTERFVSTAIGNVTAHEIGHMVGSYHTDNASETVNLMDSGGANFQNLFGVGPDGVGGTDDDPNVAFEEDTYTPAEGFTGLEDTQNVTAWAYPGR